MLEEKRNSIHKIIDTLLSIKIEEQKLLNQDQINYFIEFKKIIDNIADENSLDLIIENLVITISDLLNKADALSKNISLQNRTFLENIDKYEETKDINNLFFNL
ncbi:hypothetical protein M0P65_06250 [Candidatus Gracilibacteria bacterium]|nr:hypothetical protein [Candidatus Gracilibacteria bacterium]